MAHLCPYHADYPTFGRLFAGLNHINRSPSLYLRPCHPSLRSRYKESGLQIAAADSSLDAIDAPKQQYNFADVRIPQGSTSEMTPAFDKE